MHRDNGVQADQHYFVVVSKTGRRSTDDERANHARTWHIYVQQKDTEQNKAAPPTQKSAYVYQPYGRHTQFSLPGGVNALDMVPSVSLPTTTVGDGLVLKS